MAEAPHGWHRESRGVKHRHGGAAGIDGPFAVSLARFKFARSGRSIATPLPQLGADTDSVLAELGYAATEIADLRAAPVA